MRKFLTISVWVFAMVLWLCCHKCHAQVPQYVGAWYQFKATEDSLGHRLPVSAPLAPYKKQGSLYYNTGDSALHWYSGHNDLTFNTRKPYPFTDTLIKIYTSIPQPTGTGVNGDPITWIPITGGGHFASTTLDSIYTVNTDGFNGVHIGFPTAQSVGTANLQTDEQTYPLSPQCVGLLDAFSFAMNLQQSGLGVNIVGTGAGGVWGVQSSSLNTYTYIQDTSTQGYISFDLIDGAGMYLGPTTNGTMATYNGSNHYFLNRVFSGLTRNYKYRMLDCVTGLPIIGQPSASDRVTITNMSSSYTQLDCRQFLTATNPFFAAGLPNFWFIGIVQEYPDSLKILRPAGFTATVISSSEIDLSWSAVSNAGSGYELRRSLSPNFSGETVVYRNTSTSFHNTGLTTGTHYYYRLKAIRTVISGNDIHSGYVFNNGTTL